MAVFWIVLYLQQHLPLLLILLLIFYVSHCGEWEVLFIFSWWLKKIEYLFMPVECIWVFFSSEFSYLLLMKKITLSMYIKHRIHPFYVYNLVSFNKLVQLCNHDCNLALESFYDHLKLSCAHLQSIPVPTGVLFLWLLMRLSFFLYTYWPFGFLLLWSAYVKVFWVLFLVGLWEPVLPDTNPLKVYVMHLLFSCFIVCLLFLLMMSFFI